MPNLGQPRARDRADSCALFHRGEYLRREPQCARLHRQRAPRDLGDERDGRDRGVSLWVGLLTSDFSLEYVASYSSTTLPTIYKITSLWGGQQGSLLFWTLLLSTFASIVAFQNRRRNPEIAPYALAVMAVVAVFFLVMLNFVTRPFDLLAVRSRRRLRPQSAAAELLDGDSSALSVHRLCQHHGAVRIRRRRR